MNIIVGSSIGSATLTYEVIAVLGYLTFGSKVGANIIAMYPSTSMFIAVGQLAIVVLVLFSYPLQVHPCRNCLDKVFTTYPMTVHRPVVVVTQADDGPDELEGGDAIQVEDELGKSEMKAWKHAALTSGIVAGGFLIAYVVDDLQLGE